ncbi:MAG: hypothetical protein H6Q52_968 [Deltaproteobacteria bacterium]|nr:hypothetical protein [Deltaproteobacteria bacterium]
MNLYIGKKGFTLIELIVVIVVLAILGGFTFSFMDNAVKAYVLVREQDNLYSDGTYIMERIVKELADAKSIERPESGTGNTLEFTKAHSSSYDPALKVTFTKNNRDLLRNTNIIGINIKTFVITRNPADPVKGVDESITVLLELDNSLDTTIPVLSLTTTIAPNNYNFPTSNYAERSYGGNYYENIK